MIVPPHYNLVNGFKKIYKCLHSKRNYFNLFFYFKLRYYNSNKRKHNMKKL